MFGYSLVKTEKLNKIYSGVADMAAKNKRLEILNKEYAKTLDLLRAALGRIGIN